MSRIDSIKDDRRSKLDSLKQLGINPFPGINVDRISIETARSQTGQTVSVAGRLTAKRGHGKLMFADLQDATAKIQLMLKSDVISPDLWSVVVLLDTGDFIQVQGEVGQTQSGEVTIIVNTLTLLSKSLRPLPDKWHGLTDVEERYRHRYVDMLVNPDVLKVIKKRTRITQSLRDFLNKHDFLEVETPILQPIYGGATAKPFTTHYNALDSQFYLRISDELYLKRLIVGGIEKVYEIGHDFRNEGLSREHNPEFTMLEFYWAYADYNRLMDFTQEMLKYLVQEVNGSLQVTYKGEIYDFQSDIVRKTYAQLFQEYLNIDLSQIKSETQIIEVVKSRNLLPTDNKLAGYGKILDDVYKTHIRPSLNGPLFVTDYPTEMLPLAKRKDDNPDLIASFQLVIAGSEFLKAYNELNDPIDQRSRWEEEAKTAEEGAEEFQLLDEDYIRALEYGMPPTAGWGMGIDRLAAFLTDSPNLKEVIIFPTLKPEYQKSENSGVRNIVTGETMAFLSEEVKSKLPNTKFAYAIVKGVSITKKNDKLEELKSQLLSSLTGLKLETVDTYSSILAYRNLFKKFGIDWHSRHPSPDALLRRIAQGKSLYTINSLVDAYNLAVIETKISLGAYDLSKIYFPVKLRFSTSGESINPIGEQNSITTQAGELVYADEKQLITLDLNYRDSNLTKVTEKTKDIILFADGCEGISSDEVREALNKGLTYITDFCGGTIEKIEFVE